MDTSKGCWEFNKESLRWEKRAWWKVHGAFLISSLLTVTFGILFILTLPQYNETEVVEIENTIIIPDSSYTVKRIVYDDLVNALIHVESRGRDSIVNQTSGATGCLQLMPIMVKEVNRILERTGSEQLFTLEDRLDRNKSIAMFHIWRIYHHSGDSYEVISRCWNGGTNGYLMPETVGYWWSVKKQIPGWEKCNLD